MIPRYPHHAAFVAPARAKGEVWRLILGLVLGGIAFLMFSQLYFTSAYRLAGSRSAALYEALVTGATPLAMYVLLFSFGLMALSAALIAKVLHGRGWRSLLGPLAHVRRDFVAVSAVLIVLIVAIALLPPWDMGGDLTASLPLGRWLALLPLSLLAVLVQVSAEEIVFRGYIQQQLAARFSCPLMWMVLPSVLFALGHYLPEAAGENAILIACWAGMFGIMMADLTARAGNLGPAIAVHFWNNVTAILLVSLPDNLSGLALYLTPFGLEDTAQLAAWLPVDFASMIVFWLAARLAIRR